MSQTQRRDLQTLPCSRYRILGDSQKQADSSISEKLRMCQDKTACLSSRANPLSTNSHQLVAVGKCLASHVGKNHEKRKAARTFYSLLQDRVCHFSSHRALLPT